MMTEPSMVKILEKIPNRYMIVNIAAKRAREIAEEADLNGEELPAKPVTLALEDIVDGRLRVTDKKPAAEEIKVEEFVAEQA